MLPNPLHPAVVHFPIVLMLVFPFAAAGAMWAIRRGVKPLVAWSVPLLFAVALTASSTVSLLTGQAGEDQVERAVPEQAIERHEEAAERFLVLGSILLAVTMFGMVRGTLGTAARGISLAGSLVVIVAGVQVGKAGGDLVYKHNAGAAFANGAVPVSQQADKDDE